MWGQGWGLVPVAGGGGRAAPPGHDTMACRGCGACCKQTRPTRARHMCVCCCCLRVRAHRQYGRLDAQLMACLNGLLLVYGADLRPQMPTTHRCLAEYVKHAWSERSHRVKVRACACACACVCVCACMLGRLPACALGVALIWRPALGNEQHVRRRRRCRLAAHVRCTQEGVLCLCRLSLALGGATDRAVADLLGLATRDITAPGFAWCVCAHACAFCAGGVRG
jgi:hypothetical protein